MGPHNRMHRLDRLADVPIAMLMHGRLGEARVRGIQARDALAKILREVLVGSRCRQIQRVPAGGRAVEDEEDGCSHAVSVVYTVSKIYVHRRDSRTCVHFITHITVPLDAADIVRDLVVDGVAPAATWLAE